MATQLGKAYVQIVPSAKGIKAALTRTLTGESAGVGEKVGSSIGGRIKDAIVAAGITTAITKVVSDAISEGAKLQQAFGGIETLFKGSADQMKEYAAQAYRTAGISANEYMEQTTSFAASLISSCENDTTRAAELANMAMIDMSDNANKMGTDIESIQNAYQGFAKQNYTINLLSCIAVTLYRVCVNLIKGVSGHIRLLTGEV